MPNRRQKKQIPPPPPEEEDDDEQSEAETIADEGDLNEDENGSEPEAEEDNNEQRGGAGNKKFLQDLARRQRGQLGKKTNQKRNDASVMDSYFEQEMREVYGVVDEVQDIFNMIEKCAVEILPLVEGEEQSKLFQRYAKVAEEIIETQVKLPVVPGAVSTAYDELDIEELVRQEKNDAQFFSLLGELEESATKQAETQFKKIGRKEVVQNKTYQRFMQKLNQCVAESGQQEPREKQVPNTSARVIQKTSSTNSRHSEGLEALTEYIPTTDPLTKKTFVNPFVNKMCGHVYEYEPMMNLLITSRGKTKCPYPGCTNRQPIKDIHLVKDEEMVRKIRQRIAEDKDL